MVTEASPLVSKRQRSCSPPVGENVSPAPSSLGELQPLSLIQTIEAQRLGHALPLPGSLHNPQGLDNPSKRLKLNLLPPSPTPRCFRRETHLERRKFELMERLQAQRRWQHIHQRQSEQSPMSSGFGSEPPAGGPDVIQEQRSLSDAVSSKLVTEPPHRAQLDVSSSIPPLSQQCNRVTEFEQSGPERFLQSQAIARHQGDGRLSDVSGVNLTALVNVDKDGGQRGLSRPAVGQSGANDVGEDSQSEEGESEPNMDEDGEQRGSSRAAVWQRGANDIDEDSQNQGGESKREGEESNHEEEDSNHEEEESQSEGEESQSLGEESEGEMGESRSDGEDEIDQLDADDDYEAPTSASGQLQLVRVEGDFQLLGSSNNSRTPARNSDQGLFPSPMEVDAADHPVSPSVP